MLQKSYKHISIVFLFGSVRRGPIVGVGAWQRAAPFGFRGQPFAMIYKTVVSDSTVIRLYFFAFRFWGSSVFFAGDSAFALSFVAAA